MDFIEIIKFIDKNRLSFFTSQDLAQSMGVEPNSIHNYLETLANNELINRIEKGKYCRIYLKDPFIIGSNLIEGGVISHKSALIYHHFIDHGSNEVYVSSERQKLNKTIIGYYFRFIKIGPHKHFGFRIEENHLGSFRITDPEKTILDCFDLPQYGVSYSRLVSLFRGLELDTYKLTEYGFRLNNLSVLKRIAYLSERLNIPGYSQFRESISRALNSKYTLLDPSGKDTGPFDSRWRIRDNLAIHHKCPGISSSSNM